MENEKRWEPGIPKLVNNEVVVIAAGGGGIPVYFEDDGRLEGVDGVIDKDRASAILARDIHASILYILTSVEKVALNFGKPSQKDVDEMTLHQAQEYLDEGQFPSGSMGPKIEAAIEFLKFGGNKVIITSIHRMPDAIAGLTGTTIHN